MAKFSRMLGLENSTYRKLTLTGGDAVTVRTINRMADALQINPLDLITLK